MIEGIDKEWWDRNISNFYILTSEESNIKSLIKSSVNSLWNRIGLELLKSFHNLFLTFPSLEKYKFLKSLQLSSSIFSYNFHLDPYLLGIIDEDKEVRFVNDGERFFEGEELNILDPEFENLKITIDYRSYFNEYNTLLTLFYDKENNQLTEEGKGKIRELILKEGKKEDVNNFQQLFLKNVKNYIIYYNRAEKFCKRLSESNVKELIEYFPEFIEYITKNESVYKRVMKKYELSKIDKETTNLKELKDYFKFRKDKKNT